MTITDKECGILNNIVHESKTLEEASKRSGSFGLKLIEHSGDLAVPGFVGIVFEKIGEKELVLVIRGTAPRWCDPKKGILQMVHCKNAISTDFSDDYRIYKEQLPKQLQKGEDLLALVRAKYSEHNFTLRGFSLVGANTQKY